MGLFINLVKSKTGYNSKTFIMLVGVLMTFIMYMALVPIIYISVLNGLVVPWYGIASVIGSISTFAGVVIWGKVKTDTESYRNNNDEPVNTNLDGTEVG